MAQSGWYAESDGIDSGQPGRKARKLRRDISSGDVYDYWNFCRNVRRSRVARCDEHGRLG